MKTLKSKRAFSLVEVIISVVIFTLVAGGLFASHSFLRQSSARAERRLRAAYLGKQLFEQLRAKIDATTWTAGNLDTLTCDAAPGTLRDWPGGIPAGFTDVISRVQYECVHNPNDIHNLRKVTLTITYNNAP